MSLKLSKHFNQKPYKIQLPSYFTFFNGQHQLRHCSAFVRSTDRRQTTPPPARRGGRGPRQQVRLLNGSSLPLSSLFHPCHDCNHHRPHRQGPCILPHSPWLSTVQEQMLTSHHGAFNSRASLALNLNSRDLYVNSALLKSHCRMLQLNPRAVSGLGNFDVRRKGFQSRCFCGVTDGDDSEFDGELEGNGIEGGTVKSKADPQEVERVCKIVEELFALDRNMEAVLDECGIDLTHGLVVDVLERFKHARRPAFRFFCWAGQKPGFSHDSRTYNSMMAVLGKTRQFETMVSVLEEMGGKGLLTIETFQISIRAFATAKERKKAVGVFDLMKKYKFKVGVDTINCLLDNLGSAKLGKEAQVLFEKLNGSFTPNLQTYTILLRGWCRIKNLLEAGKMWNEMIDKGFKPDIVAYNTMLEGLLRGHKRSDAIKLFEVMKAKGPAPDIRSYTILVWELCKHKRMDEAVKCFEEMIDSGYKPDVAVYTCLITGFGNQRKMDKVYGLLTEMKEKGCPPDGRMYNALIKLMTNRQMPDDAVRIYKKMIQSGIQPTIHTYNMMLKSYFVTKNYDMACSLWEEMIRNGCCPDDNSYIVFIGGLIRLGRSIEACKYLEEMIEKGMKAPQLDYNKFAADFSRAGKPDILEDLAQKMKFAGKFEVSDVFARWAEMMRKRVNRRDHETMFKSSLSKFA